MLQIELLKSKLKFDDAFNYKTIDDWSKKLKEVAPGAPNPCHCCSQTCPAKVHVPKTGGLTAVDGVNIYFENVGGKVSTAQALTAPAEMPAHPLLQLDCRCWWVLSAHR